MTRFRLFASVLRTIRDGAAPLFIALFIALFTARFNARFTALFTALLALALLSTPAAAGPGHDHGDGAAAAPQATSASPRFSAHSDLFELTGIVKDKTIVLYLDEFASNAPVPSATIDLELQPASGTPFKLKAAPAEDGTFAVTLTAALAPGEFAITATVRASLGGKPVDDLLSSNLVIPSEIKPLAQSGSHQHFWPYGASGAALAAILGVVAWIKLRAAGRRRIAPAVTAAMSAATAAALIPALLTLATTTALLTAEAAWAGPGHDHGEAAPAAQMDTPRRLPSGDVFLPKPSQRRLGIRTAVAEAGEFARAYELNGRVVADPNAGGQVQAMQAGRLVPGPKGLPALGAKVLRGEVLAHVEPAIGAVERGNQAAQLADLRAQHESAKKRAARLEQLEGAVPQKDIDNARLDVQSLNARAAAIGASLGARETLRAPVAGVISVANAQAGQVVDARQVIYEVVNPQRLMIEALTYDEDRGAGIVSAALRTPDGSALKLTLTGTGAQLREQALPLMFRIEGAAALVVNQPVRITAQSSRRIKAVAVPNAALARNAANETIVWVHSGAETFAPRAVRIVPLDGTRTAVTAGLAGGERVVVDGTQLVGQVR